MIVVTVPIPPYALNPNARPHYLTKARVKARYRRDCYLAALSDLSGYIMPRWEKATVDVRWYGKTKTCLSMDRDNAIASLKAAIDGLTDVGVWVDDHGVTWGTVTIDVCKLDPRVELVIDNRPDVAGVLGQPTSTGPRPRFGL